MICHQGSTRSTHAPLIPFHDIAESLGGATRSKPIPANEQDLKSPRTIAMEKAKAKKKAEDDFEWEFFLWKDIKIWSSFFLSFSV